MKKILITTEFYDNSAVRRQDRLLDAERAEEIIRIDIDSISGKAKKPKVSKQ